MSTVDAADVTDCGLTAAEADERRQRGEANTAVIEGLVAVRRSESA